jgi:hypothetical protein
MSTCESCNFNDGNSFDGQRKRCATPAASETRQLGNFMESLCGLHGGGQDKLIMELIREKAFDSKHGFGCKSVFSRVAIEVLLEVDKK